MEHIQSKCQGEVDNFFRNSHIPASLFVCHRHFCPKTKRENKCNVSKVAKHHVIISWGYNELVWATWSPSVSLTSDISNDKLMLADGRRSQVVTLPAQLFKCPHDMAAGFPRMSHPGKQGVSFKVFYDVDLEVTDNLLAQ